MKYKLESVAIINGQPLERLQLENMATIRLDWQNEEPTLVYDKEKKQRVLIRKTNAAVKETQQLLINKLFAKAQECLKLFYELERNNETRTLERAGRVIPEDLTVLQGAIRTLVFNVLKTQDHILLLDYNPKALGPSVDTKFNMIHSYYEHHDEIDHHKECHPNNINNEIYKIMEKEGLKTHNN